MLTREGIDVVFSYCSDEAAKDSLLAETEAYSGHAYAVKADVGTKEGVEAIFETALAKLGMIEILFNNAGVFLDGTSLLHL